MSQIEEIKELHNQGQFEAAIKGYQQILAENPNDDEAHFGMAHASSRVNELVTALQHINEAVKLAPNSDRYQQFKGQMLLANQKIDEALKAFKRSLKENPNLFYSYLAVGDIYAIKNQSDKARAQYELALKVHKNGIPAIIKLAKLELLEGNYATAEDLLQQAELQFPTEPNLKLQMGIMRLEQREDGFAELYFKKILEDEPNNQVAKAYLAISLLHSDPEQATEIMTEMINAQIKIPELMVALGLLYGKNNDHQTAINYLKPICQSGLAYPSWLMALARAFAGNRQPNSSMAVLHEILKRGDNPKALMMLGQIHQVNNNLSQAIKTYQRIDAEDPLYHEALLMQAECAYAQNKYQEVIDRLEPILKQQADHNSAIKLKLNALSQLGQYQTALDLIDSIDASKQVDKFNQVMSLYAGLLNDALGQYDSAWQQFAQLKHPDSQPVELLSAAEEKEVQAMPSQSADTVFRFVFTDPSTGHHDFINWLLDNNITPLIDRFTTKTRGDVFTQQWTIDMLKEVSETQAHLLRKKYTRQVNQVLKDDANVVIDFLPFSPMNVAIIKRIFPQAQIMVLTRNMADLRLHDAVFGPFQVHYMQFSKVTNQMIAMNPNVMVVDIDAWQEQETGATEQIHKMFGAEVKPFKLAAVKPLDTMMFPYKHWKNYASLMNS